jgi:hypothetical protein
MRRPLAAILAALLLPPVCRAQPAVSFPLEGRYRPGKYMPVRVTEPEAPDPAARSTIRLSADGAVATELERPTGPADVVIPWLVIGESPRDATWSAPGASASALPVTLRPLNEGERLVGLAGAEPAAARSLFRYTGVVPVRLDPADPLPGPLAAWQSLDGLVLDAAAVPWLTERRLESLLAAGTTIAVRTADRPTGAWPWERQGDYWVVRADPAGPRGAVHPDAYAPTEAWSPGWPAAFRRQVVVGTILFALLALAASLWRSRAAAALAVAGLSLAALAAFALWRARQPSTIAAGGAIIVAGGAQTRIDDWNYFRAMNTTQATTPWPDAPAVSRPVFFSSRQAAQIGLRLIVAPDGRPRRFAWEMKPGTAVAFLSRTARPGPWDGAVSEPVTSPLREVAQSLYVRAGWSLAGQSTDAASQAAAGRWPAVVVRATGPEGDAPADPR